jgi:transcriptional regulator GlxA family with amidase domain
LTLSDYILTASDTHHVRRPEIGSEGAPREAAGTLEVGFLLLPGFSLLSYASAVEPFRAANRLAGAALYDWRHISLDGAAVEASNGVAILPDYGIDTEPQLDYLFVCAGGNPALFDHRPTLRWLRRLSRKRVRIGGISGGPYILARAGLLHGHRCTLHWEHIPAFEEEFPDVRVERTLFIIDRDRFTCAGGIAALDLVHALIEQDCGRALAASVSEWFLHTHVRLGSGPQRMTMRERLNVTNARVLKVLEIMNERLEEPASGSELSALAGVSVRQLERLFAAHLKTSVGEHYQRMRLEHAQVLLRQTAMPIVSVAVACGFTSASHFSRAYRRRFGYPPRGERSDQRA